MGTTFTKLNVDWNAEPNAPDPRVMVDGVDVLLEFLANPYQFPRFAEGQRLRVRFGGAVRYRLGETNDEGWYRGQCRFSGIAPAWGEFYELAGDLKLEQVTGGWIELSPRAEGPARHFLFYLRDETFECTASAWSLEP
jgi:hypothetical protein